MQILIIEPYFTGSHKAWAEGYQKYSAHEVKILSLGGQFWKWRMHGGAITLAHQFLEQELNPDLILATDMLDVTTFLALTRDKTASIPVAIYFHENQLCYPWSPEDQDVFQKRDQHYGFINYTSALAADAVFFNSAYQKKCFLNELPNFLKQFPDHRGLENVARIAAKSQVLHLGLDTSPRRIKKDASLWLKKAKKIRSPSEMKESCSHQLIEHSLAAVMMNNANPVLLKSNLNEYYFKRAE